MSFGSGSFGSFTLGSSAFTSSDVELALTGTQSTASVGSLTSTQTISRTLTGTQSTASVGSLTSTALYKIIGTESSSSVGSLAVTTWVVESLSGLQTTSYSGSLGSLQVSTDYISAVTSTVSDGSLTNSSVQSTGLSGTQSTASVGSLTAAQIVFIPLSGTQSVSNTGNIAIQIATATNGSQSAAFVGNLSSTQTVSTSLTGIQTSSSTSSLTNSSAQFNTLTGTQSTSALGNFGKIISIALTGSQSNVTVGALSDSTSYALVGNQTIALTESLTTSQVSNTVLNSNSTTIYSGNMGVMGGEILVSLTGVESIITVKQLFPFNEIQLTGVESIVETGILHVIGDFPEVTGTSQEVLEFEEFTVSWPTPYTPTSYTLSKNISGIELFVIGDTVYAGGRASDIFERTIEYLDTNLQLNSVSRFVDLPNEYYGITRYIAPTEQIKKFYVVVEYYDEIELVTKTIVNELNIKYNFTISNKALKDAVRKEIA